MPPASVLWTFVLLLAALLLLVVVRAVDRNAKDLERLLEPQDVPRDLRYFACQLAASLSSPRQALSPEDEARHRVQVAEAILAHFGLETKCAENAQETARVLDPGG